MPRLGEARLATNSMAKLVCSLFATQDEKAVTFQDRDGKTMRTLLAVDLGLKTGLALYGEDGKLIWYRSHNFGTTERLRRGAHGILNGTSRTGGPGHRRGRQPGRGLGKRGRPARHPRPADWFRGLAGAVSLSRANGGAGRRPRNMPERWPRKIIDWSGAARPSSLRHDAAEAILIGLWGVLQFGWLPAVPQELRR